MNIVRSVLCATMVLLWVSAGYAQTPAPPDTNALFERALDLALPRDTAPVAAGDTRITLRVTPPKGHESQVIFLLHGKTTTAEAMQAVSVRQQFADWAAQGQTMPLEEWAKTVQVTKANFEVTPQMRALLDGSSNVDFDQCLKQQDTVAHPIHYELWVETDKNVKDIHAYSTHAAKCPGLEWMQQVRQAVRQQVPQLEAH